MSATSWTFTLREGVTFHDGSPFTATAAAFSIKRATDSGIDCNVDGYVFANSELTATPSTGPPSGSPCRSPTRSCPLRLSFSALAARMTALLEMVGLRAPYARRLPHEFP